MPEGDTVWRTARRLHEVLAGKPLVVTDFRVPAYATVDLSGQTVREVVSRGKHLLTRVEPAISIHTHLKMEGSWHVYRAGSRWRSPDHQVRLILGTTNWVAVGFRLGLVEVLATSEEAGAVGHLGPDLLGPDWDPAEAVRRLRRQPNRPIGDALADQRNLAGIGNMYKAEICFLAGLNPLAPVTAVHDLPGVVDLAQRILGANKARAVQSTTGDIRRGRTLWVYGRFAEPCRRCGTPIRRSSSRADRSSERATYWCPGCQPDPGLDG